MPKKTPVSPRANGDLDFTPDELLYQARAIVAMNKAAEAFVDLFGEHDSVAMILQGAAGILKDHYDSNASAIERHQIGITLGAEAAILQDSTVVFVRRHAEVVAVVLEATKALGTPPTKPA